MGMDLGKGYLESGTEMAFEMKVAGSDGVEYTVEDAERRDLAYLVENSCISCNRHLNKDEVKIVPPRYIQERDHYVKSGAVARRLMCVECYNTLKIVTNTKTRVRHYNGAAAHRGFLMKTLINNLLLK